MQVLHGCWSRVLRGERCLRASRSGGRLRGAKMCVRRRAEASAYDWSNGSRGGVFICSILAYRERGLPPYALASQAQAFWLCLSFGRVRSCQSLVAPRPSSSPVPWFGRFCRLAGRFLRAWRIHVPKCGRRWTKPVPVIGLGASSRIASGPSLYLRAKASPPPGDSRRRPRGGWQPAFCRRPARPQNRSLEPAFVHQTSDFGLLHLESCLCAAFDLQKRRRTQRQGANMLPRQRGLAGFEESQVLSCRSRQRVQEGRPSPAQRSAPYRRAARMPRSRRCLASPGRRILPRNPAWPPRPWR